MKTSLNDKGQLIDEKIEVALEALKVVKNLEEWKQLKAKFLSKNELIDELKQALKDPNLDASVKKSFGDLINLYLKTLNQAFADKKNDLENQFFLEARDNPLLKNDRVKFSSKKVGGLHPLTIAQIKVKTFFDALNYEFLYGLEIEEEKYNFDILNIPSDHPARSMHDSLYFENKLMLRTHSTNITARKLLQDARNELFSYSIGTVFRNDDNDATHSFQFNQIDLFVTSDRIISIANLKTTMDRFLKSFFDNQVSDTRYRVSYFPFTEPSFEVDVMFNKNDQQKWIEVLGCGMIHRNVIQNANKDANIINGFAAGIGLERIAMLKWGISDIRDFYQNDINFLEKFRKEI